MTKKIVIREVSINDSFRVYGRTIHGLSELKQMVELSNRDYRLDSACYGKVKWGWLHVGLLWDSYPRFDSFDDCDNRSYQTYIIRRLPIRKTELLRVKDIPCRGDSCYLHDSTPLDMLPMVYYRGEGNTMLIALPG